MSHHSVQVDDEVWEVLKDRQMDLTPPELRGKRNKEASHSKVIITLNRAARDIQPRLNLEFDIINTLLLLRYRDKDKAKAVSERLRIICLNVLQTQDNYDYYMAELDKVITGANK